LSNALLAQKIRKAPKAQLFSGSIGIPAYARGRGGNIAAPAAGKADL